MDENDYDKWLASESVWKRRLGKGWIGKKVLGKGSFGVAGLWEYEGDIQPPPTFTKIVVKQQAHYPDVDDEELEIEGRILTMLSTVQSRHVVRIFGSVRLDTYAGFKVSRILLEYCPGGNIEQLLEDPGGRRNSVAPAKPLIEADIWAVFHCLALGVAVMDRGTEDSTTTPWDRETVIVHYDIHPENVFMGYKDFDHPRYPIAKIADFGEAAEEDRNMQHTEEKRVRGAMPYNPPEVSTQTLGLMNRKFGTWTNVYQVGCIVHALMTRQAKNFNKDVIYISKLINGPPIGFTQGEDMDHESIAALYSSQLRVLVMECMMREPDDRPGALSLQSRTAAGLAAALTVAEEKKVFDANPNPFARIPSMENVWLEPPVLDEDFNDSRLPSSPLPSTTPTTPSASGLTPPGVDPVGGGSGSRSGVGGDNVVAVPFTMSSSPRRPKRARVSSPEVGRDNGIKKVKTASDQGGTGGNERLFELFPNEGVKTGGEEGREEGEEGEGGGDDPSEVAPSDGEEGSHDRGPISEYELGRNIEQKSTRDGNDGEKHGDHEGGSNDGGDGRDEKTINEGSGDDDDDDHDDNDADLAASPLPPRPSTLEGEREVQYPGAVQTPRGRPRSASGGVEGLKRPLGRRRLSN